MSEQNSEIEIEKETRFSLVLKFIFKHREVLALGVTFLGTIIAIITAIIAIWAVQIQNDVSREAVRVQNDVARELAHQQSFLQFYQQWESDGMQQRRAQLSAELKSQTSKNTLKDIDDSPLVFLETLSAATKRGLVDEDLVWTSFYVDVTGYWAAAEPYIRKIRKEGCSCYYVELESLNNKLHIRAQEEARKSGQSESIMPVKRFLELERKRYLPEKSEEK